MVSPPKRPTASECVRVVVRCRPLTATEAAAGSVVAVDVLRGPLSPEPDPDSGVNSIPSPSPRRAPGVVRVRLPTGRSPPEFCFDDAFPPGASQAEVFESVAAPVVDGCMAGVNGTVFCYGQTGSGKTFTMDGGNADPASQGLIPRSFRRVFESIEAAAVTHPARVHLVSVSYLEIFNDTIRDLLAVGAAGAHRRAQGAGLGLRESPTGAVDIPGLTHRALSNAATTESRMAEAAGLVALGRSVRSTAATAMNAASSRSHAVLTVTIEVLDSPGSQPRQAKLHLVDLAGSERQGKSGATGARLAEAAEINGSLLALGRVIAALVASRSSGKGPVPVPPYRDCKLTRLLRDSLGGTARTAMVANVGPAASNAPESVATLAWACLARQVRNAPVVNEDPRDSAIRTLQAEIAALRIAAAAGGGCGGGDDLASELARARADCTWLRAALSSAESGGVAATTAGGDSDGAARERADAADRLEVLEGRLLRCGVAGTQTVSRRQSQTQSQTESMTSESVIESMTQSRPPSPRVEALTAAVGLLDDAVAAERSARRTQFESWATAAAGKLAYQVQLEGLVSILGALSASVAAAIAGAAGRPGAAAAVAAFAAEQVAAAAAAAAAAVEAAAMAAAAAG